MRVLALAMLANMVLPAAGRAAEGFMRQGAFEGRPAVVFTNNRLELTVLKQGNSLADLVLRDDPERLSPLWNPVRMAREAGQKPPLGAGLGHFLCVDGFGGVSVEERAAGMPGHGEAHTVQWELVSADKRGGTGAATFSATLPLVQETLRRTIRMVDGENVVYVETELESLLAFDRPVCWAEHATIGSPFLEPGKTVVDMSAVRGKTRPHSDRPGRAGHRLASSRDFNWPLAPGLDGQLIDLRAAPLEPNSMDHTTCLMDPARELVFVTALHAEKRLLLGYVFKREEYPWLQSWEHYPQNLKLARGLEFSTLPFDVPRREAIQTNSLFDTPTYRWLPARSKIGSRFLMFYTRTPEGFSRIDDVTLENGRLTIEDRKAGKRMALPASLGL
jgi:hypothetical protein